MSNLEKDPAVLLMTDPPATVDGPTAPETDDAAAPAVRAVGIEILEPREVPLGGPRAMDVRRTLPQRQRSLIGGWCFVDQYGPERTAMVVPPHPHTGLQTVSWLFAGEIEHRDSVGSLELVRPGEVNLMTAGSGIQHSEVSTTSSDVLHGVQLWVALPDASRHTAPFFEHFTPSPFVFEGATISVFVGSLLGASSPVAAFSPLLGAQLDIPAGTTVTLPVSAAFEHGVLVDSGELAIDGVDVPVAHLAFLTTGRSVISLVATSDVRLILLGGEPLGEQIVMWWNFIGRSHDEIVAYRSQWQSEVIGGSADDGRFGRTEYAGSALPAPELPTVRLKPRG